MLESREIEIAAEFAIDARQQIHVERGRHAGGIVVGQHSASATGFSRSVASSSASPYGEFARTSRRKLIAGRPVKIPDRAAEKKHQQPFAVAPARGHFLQAVQIGALEADDADAIHLAEFLLAAMRARCPEISIG